MWMYAISVLFVISPHFTESKVLSFENFTKYLAYCFNYEQISGSILQLWFPVQKLFDYICIITPYGSD